MLTPFGVTIRKLRLDKGQRLLDLANQLGKSSAFISAIETGKKPIPSRYVEEVSAAMGLTRAETDEVNRAADRTRKDLAVENLSAANRELVAAFARRLNDLPTELVEKLKETVFKKPPEFKVEAGSIPFSRGRRGLIVPPASTKALRNIAQNVRDAFVGGDTIAFPIMDVLEFRLSRFIEGFFLDVQSKDDMAGEEGRVVADGQRSIILREDVYDDAWTGDGRARFTACHELAHLLLHSEVRFARMRDDSHPIYRDSEWQADTFAAALLMSPRHVHRFTDAYHAAAACQMTYAAAEVSWAKYQKEGLISGN